MTVDSPPPDALIKDLLQLGVYCSGDRFETLYGGRTNRVWKLAGQHSDQVLKLYQSGFANPLFRNDARLEAECLRVFKSSGFVPQLRATGVCGAESWVLYDHAPGSPWRENPETVAHLLNRLHSSNVTIPVPEGCNGSDDLARHAEDILNLCEPDDRDVVMLRRPNRDVPPLSDRRLIHGDPVAGNILIAGKRATLIDWQCPAFGDPCEDLALFLSPAMQWLYRGQPLSQDEIKCFLDAYHDVDIVARYHELRHWFGWRMAAYCLWRSRNGAKDYETGLQLELDALSDL